MHTALVIIEDCIVVDMLMASFRAAGFHPVSASDLDEAHRIALQFRPDVLVVDIDLYHPQAVMRCFDSAVSDGGRPTPVPTIMLTSKPADLCGERGARCGAAVCSPKPIRPKELVMTSVRLVRRANARLTDARWSGVIRRGPMTLDLDRFTLTLSLEDRRVPFGLGPTVTRLMAQLMQQPGAVCSREELLARVWPNDETVTARTIDQNVRRLRAILRKVDLAQSIHTVEGQGYSLVLPTTLPAVRDGADPVTCEG
jgi:DNA-binding response OmpR family regulator